MEDLTGKQLGAYQVAAPLGEGGMAAVYKAYHPAMERYVALKILPRHFASDPQFVVRFKQEAKVLAQLQHPHILPVFDFGEADGYTYLVMPFIKSGTLSQVLKGSPLSLGETIRVIEQIGGALDYAHQRGLVHRDVKPSNVLIDESNNCLLSDFGLAKIMESNARLTSSGAVMGTPVYMSPEQGMGRTVDRRSDVYSLGVMLYEMATGRVPYEADTPMAVLIKHMNDPLPPPRKINPNLPEAVEAVILKSLAKEPGDRYQTAGDMVRALNGTTREPLPTLPMMPAKPSDASPVAATQLAPPYTVAPTVLTSESQTAPQLDQPKAPPKPSLTRAGIVAAVFLVALCVLISVVGFMAAPYFQLFLAPIDPTRVFSSVATASPEAVQIVKIDTSANCKQSSPVVDTSTTLTFVNQSNRDVSAFWLDEKGLEQFYSDIPIGQSFRVDTGPGHWWCIREKYTGTELIAVSAGSQPETFTISPPNINCSGASESGTAATTVEFANKSQRTVLVNWLNPDGAEVFYAELAPGDSYVQDTFVNHLWCVRDKNTNAPILSVLTTTGAQVIDIP